MSFTTEFIHAIAKIHCYFQHNVITLKLRKEYLIAVTYNIPVLLQMKKWTVWYMDLFYMSTYTGVTNFEITVRFFGPPCM